MIVNMLVESPVPPDVVTAIWPLDVPLATAAVICVSESTPNDATGVPPIDTPLAPVNPEPVIVTVVPTTPLVGVKLVTVGFTVTTNESVEVPVPAGVVIEIGPVVVPL